jgi:acetyl-CoA C-acetyltransferase
MRDVVICEPVRTAVGRYGGVFRDVDAVTLAVTVVREILHRTGIPGTAVDEVILGQATPGGEAPAIGRVVALDAGLGLAVPGRQVDRRCGSGLQAVIDAVMQVQSGASELILAGGVENMSQAEHYALNLRWGVNGEIRLRDRLERARVTAGGRSHLLSGGTLETAENIRKQYGISRQEQDELSVLSHRKAVAAQNSGTFTEEIVPVSVPQRRGDAILVDTDEHPRPDTTLEALSRLKPVRLAQDPVATVTAGNSSGQNDGAALTIVTTAERARQLGIVPFGRLKSWGAAGVAPETMGIGAVPATHIALRRAGLNFGDLGVIELNEAFAAQTIAVLREWQISPDDARLNPSGSGISLGHPVGATGARMLTTMLRGMRRYGHRYGLETMCIAGGQGLAAIFERA